MRQIDEKVEEAFWAAKAFKSGNTEIIINHSSGANLFLYGNGIASYDKKEKELALSTCGWPTQTTVGRLNAVLKCSDYSIHIHKGKAVLYWYKSNGQREETYRFWDRESISLQMQLKLDRTGLSFTTVQVILM